jgi:hypothetical protein
MMLIQQGHRIGEFMLSNLQNPQSLPLAQTRSRFKFVLASFIATLAVVSTLLVSESATAQSCPVEVCPTGSTCTPTTSKAYYVALTGSDSAAGTINAPWKTFAKAFATMRSGELLIIKNGVYAEPIGGSVQPPSGALGKLTTIRAETDGGVVIDAQGRNTPLSLTSSYVRVEGMKFLNGAQSVADISGNNSQVVRSAFGNAGAGLYDDIVNVSGNDVLIEDSWMWGRGKVGVLVGTSDTNNINNVSRRITLRRVVIRLDSYTGSLGYIGVVMYGAADTVIENVITLDFNPAPTTFDWKGGFRSRDMQGGAGKSQRYYGTIALNLPYDGYRMSDSNYENVIAWNVGGRGGLFEDSYATGYGVKNATVGASKSDGIFTNTTTISNSIMYKVAGANSSGAYNVYNQTTAPGGAPNAITADPLIKYITRTESGTVADGTGQGGADRGATVINRYENGVLTNTPLWPWPNEARIKADFQTNFGLSGVNPKRGFAADGNSLRGTPISLTSYVWEYLGNPCPTDICK